MFTLSLFPSHIPTMEYSVDNSTMTQQDILSHFSFQDSFPSPSPSSSSSPSSQTPPTILPPPTSPPSGQQPPLIITPCAACKILRRRCCVDKCLLAPYFLPTEPLKFTIAHRVFGASNITKFLQDLPESERADAVSSMVYEANARIRDPVYGSAGVICHLQRQVRELQEQLATAQAEMVIMERQQADLVSLICMKTSHQEQTDYSVVQYDHQFNKFDYFPEDGSFGSAWEPLWA